MGILHNLWIVAATVLLLNLPFGFWRASVRKFSLLWVVAVHAPVPCVIVLRIISGLGWRLESFPVMVGAYFGGQFLGGKMQGWWTGSRRAGGARPAREAAGPRVEE